jgi:hypothetical protein
MTTSGFYKSDLTYAPNWVIAPGFELLRSAKDSYTYPVEGWYWFDSLEQACTFFDVPVPSEFNQGTEFIPSNGGTNWDGFNAYMLTDPVFKTYRDTVRAIDGDLNAALFNAYALIERNGVAAFTLVWSQWTQSSGITTEDRETIATVAESFDLPVEFVEVIRG